MKSSTSPGFPAARSLTAATEPPSALKCVVLALCAYEIGAIASGKVPTVSALSHRYWWFEVALLAAYAVDVHHLQRRIAARRVPD